MGRKTNLSILVFVLGLAEAICYFVRYCLVAEYWEYQKSNYYHGIAQLKSHRDINIFEIDTRAGKVFAALLVCITLIMAAVYLFKAIKGASATHKSGWLVSIVHTIVMIMFLLYACIFAEAESISYMYTYSFGWMFFVIIALNVIATALSAFLRFSKVHDGDAVEAKDNQVKNDTDLLDELLAYKELLDSGIITQEEFDNKKKQLRNT